MQSRTIDVIKSRFKKSDEKDMENAGDNAIPVDTAARKIIMSPGGLHGARGRDVSGQPVDIPVGMPPAMVGEGRHFEIPKDALWPPMPPNTERFSGIAVTANSGVIFDRQLGFPCRGMQIDNYTTVWLFIPSAQRYIPPLVTGIQFAVFPAASKMQIIAEAPPGFTQPANTATNVIEVTCIEKYVEYSPGIPIQGQGGSPIPTLQTSANVLGGSATTTAATLITIPANRIWVGTVAVEASASAPPVTAQANSSARVDVTLGTGGVGPATAARVDLSLAATVAGALTGSEEQDNQSNTITIYAGTTSASLATVFVTGTGHTLVAMGVASGTLL